MSEDISPESNPREELSIGELLRTEREKKEISKSRLAGIIKVRENVIDAIENEDWDKLPARVFVKGFIRSYTISIGYDTTKALRLFDKCVPSKGEDSPVPLTGGRRKSRVMYYVVPALIILVIAIYLFTVRDKDDNDIKAAQTVSETPSPTAEKTPEESIPEELESAETSAPADARETAPVKKIVAQETDIEKETAELEKSSAAQEEVLPIAEESSEEIMPDVPVITPDEPGAETVSDELSAAALTLSATINMPTYVRMIVDDNPPKEYVFQPGKTPQWSAERGFEVTVGNAAGIEFEFNGETFKNLGREGRVKTLRFPKDFETNWEEE